VAISSVLLGRVVAVYPCCAIFGWSRLRVTARHQHVLFWGGLRGALALALALASRRHAATRFHCRRELCSCRILHLHSRVELDTPVALLRRTSTR
jgi:NhaP-type Na+/H+ or K+/H+ antiporter